MDDIFVKPIQKTGLIKFQTYTFFDKWQSLANKYSHHSLRYVSRKMERKKEKKTPVDVDFCLLSFFSPVSSPFLSPLPHEAFSQAGKHDRINSQS